MKIIVITPILPYPLDKNGFALSLGSLINEWIKEKHEIHILCFGTVDSLSFDYYVSLGVFVYSENIKSKSVSFYYTNEHNRFLKPRGAMNYDYSNININIDGEFDIAILSSFESVFLFDKVKKLIDVQRIIFFEVDALSLLYGRLAENTKSLFQYVYYKVQAKLIRNVEKLYYPRFDKTCFVSSDDRKYSINQFPEVGIEKFFNIRNGVELSNVPSKINKYDPKCIELGFSGDFAYKPNQVAADFIINKILPNLCKSKFNLKFNLIGRNPTENMIRASIDYKETLNVTGEVEDVFIALNSLDLYVCPLFVGAGIKNKILNVMGIGIPFISTRIAIEGIDEFKGNIDSWIIDSKYPECWIDRIDKSLRDYDESLKIAKQYKNLISENYKWSNIAKEFIHKSMVRRYENE